MVSSIKLYKLDIRDFHSKGFFFYFIFNLDKDIFSCASSGNMKITYLTKNCFLPYSNKENTLYLIYNVSLSEVYSLPLQYSRFYNYNNKGDTLNTNLVYLSTQYNESYYNSNLRLQYSQIIPFFLKTHFLVRSFLFKLKIYNRYINHKYLFFMSCIIQKNILLTLFTSRFESIII